MSNALTQPAAFRAMKTDIQVSMDDVVSAFVSQYENNLYDRKRELSKEIRAQEVILEELQETVKKEVTGDEWASESVPFGLSLSVKQGSINWEGKLVDFVIVIEDPKQRGYYGNQVKIEKAKKIPAAYLKAYNKAQKELKELRTALSEVLVSLKSITRKERQVRGRIAMRKLEDSGYASLMADEELIQLVQLEDE